MSDEVKLEKNKFFLYDGFFSKSLSPLNLSEMGQRVYGYCKEHNLNPKLKEEKYDPYRENQDWNNSHGPAQQRKLYKHEYEPDKYDNYRFHIFIEW